MSQDQPTWARLCLFNVAQNAGVRGNQNGLIKWGHSTLCRQPGWIIRRDTEPAERQQAPNSVIGPDRQIIIGCIIAVSEERDDRIGLRAAFELRLECRDEINRNGPFYCL